MVQIWSSWPYSLGKKFLEKDDNPGGIMSTAYYRGDSLLQCTYSLSTHLSDKS